MPEMDGFELLRQLAAQNVSVAMILLTDHATPRLRARAAAAGVQLVLEKPFLDNALADSVMTIVSHDAQLRQGSDPKGT